MSPRQRYAAARRPVLAALLLLVPCVAGAHAVVYPRRSAPGAYERYVLRVPCERDIPTTRVELRFPAELRVLSFGEVVGWQLEVMHDTSGAITGAVWTGNLPPERFVELPFVAVNPGTASTLVWPVAQTYSDGMRIDWAGEPDSERPASVTEVGEVSESGFARLALTLAIAALIVGLAALALVAIRRRPASQPVH